MTSQRDAIGQRGELIARFALTQFHDGEPIFKHAFLGDKWEAADLFVETVASPKGCRDFFFVQVRTTSDLPDSNGRVSLTVKREELGALAAYPAPRYLLIVTERDGRVYIRPVETESVSTRVCKGFRKETRVPPGGPTDTYCPYAREGRRRGATRICRGIPCKPEWTRSEGPGLSQIRCEHALTVSNCLALRDDVRRYWSEHPPRPWTSMFSAAPRAQ